MLGLGCMKSCLGQILLAGFFLAATIAGWLWGPTVFPKVAEWFSNTDHVSEAIVSSDLAEKTMGRFSDFQRGGTGEQLSLSSNEVASILLYSVPDMMPEGISGPQIEMEDGIITLDVNVAVEALPQYLDMDDVLEFLPDTIEVSLAGTFAPLEDQNWGAFIVHGVQVSLIPVPERMIPDIIKILGKTDVDGLPDDAIAIPLPRGLKSVYVIRDSLVLVRDS